MSNFLLYASNSFDTICEYTYETISYVQLHGYTPRDANILLTASRQIILYFQLERWSYLKRKGKYVI